MNYRTTSELSAGSENLPTLRAAPARCSTTRRREAVAAGLATISAAEFALAPVRASCRLSARSSKEILDRTGIIREATNGTDPVIVSLIR